jgi:tRNA pseudouridine38-40 synthase
LTLEYDGTDFHGWQQQPGGLRTVAGVLSDALSRITTERPQLAAAGRTDAGAHSLGQVVSFWLASGIALERLLNGLNAVLPRDVAVVEAAAVDQTFHARFSARRRVYRYLVENRAPRSAVLRGHAWHVARGLDLTAMRAAAGLLVGRNDLGSFGTDPAGRHTVRNLETVKVHRLRSLGAGVLAVDLAADAFLYGMVRRIVGFLVEVGRGRLQAIDARALLGAPLRLATVPVAPAHGLYQMSVEY